MKTAFLLVGLALLIVGCSSGEAPPAAPTGSTTEAAAKGSQAGALKGMSENDLSVPSGAENANAPGSKLNGGK